MENESQNNLTRQIKNFQLIQSNSEFFTVLKRSLGSNAKNGVKLGSQYFQRNPKIRIDYQNFIQSFIQVAYLIYTSKYYGLNPLIYPEHVRIQENYTWGMEKKFSIIIYYSFSEQPRDNNTYSSIIKLIYKFLIDNHAQYLKNIQKQEQVDVQYETSLRNFVSQIELIETKLTQYNDSDRQREFYTHLEQTDIFRQNSLLLRIKNTSMLDYIKQKISKFKLFKQKDVNLVNEYNNQKKKTKCDLQQLKKKQKLIQKNIIQFFQQIKNTNEQKFRLKIEPDHQNYKTKFIFVVSQLPPDPFLTRISKLGKSQENLMQGQQNVSKEKVPFMEYQIQYNSDKNSICVRLILSSISCSSQSIDYILFQSNVLSFQSANINLQFVEDKIAQKSQGPPKKNLAFRGSSCFNTKEPTLQKMLVLMDLTMIAAKIYEPELLSIRKNFMIDKNPNKLSTIYQKVNHYTKIFLRCAKKVYNQ